MTSEHAHQRPLRRSSFDQPEFHLALFGFLFAFVWEMWQMSFYDTGDVPFAQVTGTCMLVTIRRSQDQGSYACIDKHARRSEA